MRLCHIFIRTNTDEKKEANFDGNLHEFATKKLNDHLARIENIISINERTWTSEIHPLECDSDTWYTRTNIELSVWYKA